MSKTLKILSRPKGNAEEYGRWSVNPYLGCSHKCLYCYLKSGPGAKTLGGSVATPKKGVVSDEHAYHLAMAEIIEHHDEIIRDGGLFMTFTSDPCAPETRNLFFRIASNAIEQHIPVMMLTKNADFFQYPTMMAMIEDTKHLMSLSDKGERIVLNGSTFCTWLGDMHRYLVGSSVAFGWTLTGHDELEPNASTNAERIATMKRMSDEGYMTWASIEPVIDFDASLQMVADAVEAGCLHFKIGLLTNNTRVVRKDFAFGEHHFDAYDRTACCQFIGYVMEVTQNAATVYWKQSFVDFFGDEPIHGMTAREFLHQWPHSVDKDWSMFGRE